LITKPYVFATPTQVHKSCKIGNGIPGGGIRERARGRLGGSRGDAAHHHARYVYFCF